MTIPNMRYAQFKKHISTLDEEEKNQLFFNIYEAYLYANTFTSEAQYSNEFYKGMAKMKRYERYLYIILGGDDKYIKGDEKAC